MRGEHEGNEAKRVKGIMRRQRAEFLNMVDVVSHRCFGLATLPKIG